MIIKPYHSYIRLSLCSRPPVANLLEARSLCTPAKHNHAQLLPQVCCNLISQRARARPKRDQPRPRRPCRTAIPLSAVFGISPISHRPALPLRSSRSFSPSNKTTTKSLVLHSTISSPPSRRRPCTSTWGFDRRLLLFPWVVRRQQSQGE
jgi:hypothetical protein